MPVKITMIGAGSIGFTRKLMHDILAVPELADTTFAMMDISAHNLQMVEQLCVRDIRANNLPATILTTTDQREAIQDADYVICTIRQGGLAAFQTDIDIPLKYGIDQCVGDTLCAGGIMYGQRTIPALLDICDDIREVAQPEQLPGRRVHRAHVEGVAQPDRVSSPERIVHRMRIGDPIAVAPTRRREARVETVRCTAYPMHGDIGRQDSRQPRARRLLGAAVRASRQGKVCRVVDVRMRHLAAGMDPRVGASGDGEPHRIGRPKQRGQCVGQHTFDGPPPRLGCPAGEVGAVVAEIQTQPHRPILPHPPARAATCRWPRGVACRTYDSGPRPDRTGATGKTQREVTSPARRRGCRPGLLRHRQPGRPAPARRPRQFRRPRPRPRPEPGRERPWRHAWSPPRPP